MKREKKQGKCERKRKKEGRQVLNKMAKNKGKGE
jgi:ribosomal protein L34